MKKKALIVDDSRLACKIMANMLNSLEIDSVSVYSAEEALEYLKHTLPDILFLDHSLPGLSGLETIKLLKSNPHTATVPVMMYTAKEGEVYVGQARALGAVDVLPKGMEKDYLIKALTKLGFISLDNEAIVNDQQKRIQADEIRYSATLQTVKITREIHKTLEQFEHALIARLAAHDEYENIKNKLEQKYYRRFIYASVVLGLVLLSVVIWQQNKHNVTVQKLIEQQNSQQQWNTTFEQLLDNINQNQLAGQTPEIEPFPLEQPTESTKQLISLIDDYGTVVVNNLVLNPNNASEYIGTTISGYSIKVNLNGEVGSLLKMRYFQNDDCSGNAYVNSESGIIYQDNKNLIWYVDKLAPVVSIKASSSINELDECVITAGDFHRVRLLERDFNMVTGIDDSQEMTLYFGE